jgi:hypothetical protein
MKKLKVDEYEVELVNTEYEINYVITNSNGYVCRLVPGYAGFELSKQDKALGNNISELLVAKLSDFIVANDE